MIRILFAVAIAAISMPLTAQLTIAGGDRLTGQDLFAIETASDPQIGPDGRSIVYVRRSGDVMHDRWAPSLWIVESDGTGHRPLVAGPGAHFSPRWSPDGSRLAYLSAGEGGTQLFVRWMESGEAVRITGLPTPPNSIAWSPDGSQIAFSMRLPGESERLGERPSAPEGADWAAPLEIYTALVYRRDGQGYVAPGYNHIFVVPAEGGTPRQLTRGDFHHDGPLSWTPDGSAILFSANRSEEWESEPLESEVYRLDLASGSLSALTDRDGPDANPVASPDGRRIAYIGFDDRRLGYHNTELHVMDSDGGNVRSLTASLDRSVHSPVWADNGRSIYVAYDDRGVTKVARVSLDGSVRDVAEGLTNASLDRPYSGGGFSLAPSGAIVATAGDGTRPPDVALYRNGGRRWLTELNADLLAARRLGEVRRIETPSSVDGRPIEAWLTLPPGHVEGQRHPLVLEIHGGPFAAYGSHFSTDNQLYAAAGYVVLSVNPRGSTSYGAEFANLIHHAYPGDDYHDLISAVDAAIAMGVANPEELFVTGGSGGGVLTSWIVGQTDRFRAAATQKPVIDWSSQTLTADIPNLVADYWFGAMPWEAPEEYWRRSPLSLIGNVTTPTLVVVGSEDYRTPPSEAEQYYVALRLRGVPTALIHVPDASHGGLAARPSQSAAKASAIIAWFDRYREEAWEPESAE